jgi:hypothetical protein
MLFCNQYIPLQLNHLCMKLKSLLTSLLVLAFISLQAQTKALTADEILAKYFVTTGGVEKWKAMKSRTAGGKGLFAPGQEFPMTQYEMAPNKQKVVVNVQGTEMILVSFDGKDAWSFIPFQGVKEPVMMPEEQAKDVKDQEFENSFIDYKKKGHEVTLEGTEEIDGIKCYKIKLVRNKNNPKDDVTETHYFDAENFVEILQAVVPTSGQLKGTEIRTYLSDYQEAGGLMHPFSIEQKANGQTVLKFTVEKVTVNDIKDETIFAFPKK